MGRAKPKKGINFGGSDWQRWQKESYDAVCNPKVGMRFNEMYSYWQYVVCVHNGYIICAEGAQNWIFTIYNEAGFRKTMCYGSEHLDKTTVSMLTDRGGVIPEKIMGHVKAFREMFEGAFGATPEDYLDKDEFPKIYMGALEEVKNDLRFRIKPKPFRKRSPRLLGELQNGTR